MFSRLPYDALARLNASALRKGGLWRLRDFGSGAAVGFPRVTMRTIVTLLTVRVLVLADLQYIRMTS